MRQTVRSAPYIPTHPSVALALGGGGARGLAHILVLEVLDELGVRPSLIAGTSMGALVGAAYAMGLPAYRLRAIMEETLGNRFELVRQLFAARSEPIQHLLRVLPIRTSLLAPEALLERLMPEIDDRPMESLPVPLKVVATDLVQRTSVVMESGPLRRAVAASIAIPLVFSPIAGEGCVLVDGGLVNPLPFDLITGAADITIAVDVSGTSGDAALAASPSATEVLMQSILIMERAITHQKLKSLRPDIYLDIGFDAFGALEFWRAREIIAAAQPIKQRLKRQLERQLTARNVEALPPPGS